MWPFQTQIYSIDPFRLRCDGIVSSLPPRFLTVAPENPLPSKPVIVYFCHYKDLPLNFYIKK